MNTTFSGNQFPQRGLTLIELLVVVFIMMIFVAAAAPLVNPDNTERKIREASRQINAYVAEAKAHAAQRNRPVGIAFDRATAVREGSRDSNFITRLYLVEVPPNYTGDTLSALMQYYWLRNDDDADLNDTNDPVPPEIRQVRPPEVPITAANGGTTKYMPPLKLQLKPQQCFMLDTIVQSYVPQGSTTAVVPFTIRLGGRPTWRPGFAVYSSGNPTQYFLWLVYGDPMYGLFNNIRLNTSQNAFPYLNSSPLPANNGATNPPYYYFEDTLTMSLPPLMTGDSPLELPAGTLVDMQFSGTGATGTEFFDQGGSGGVTAGGVTVTPKTSPLVLLFAAGGHMSAVMDGISFLNVTGKCHLLVGTTRLATEARTIDPGVDTRNFVQGTLADPKSLWVSVGSQAGHVTTSENVIPTQGEITYYETQGGAGNQALARLAGARRLAITVNTAGGQ